MAEKRHIGRKKAIGDIYMYPTGRYVREKVGSSRGCVDYRVIPVPGKPGRKVLICIRSKRGPRGGRTKAVAILRDVKRVPKAKRMLRRLVRSLRVEERR